MIFSNSFSDKKYILWCSLDHATFPFLLSHGSTLGDENCIFNADGCTHTVWAFDCSVDTDNKASCYLSQGCSVRHFDKKPFTYFALLHTDVSSPNVIYSMAKSRGSILWIINEVCVGTKDAAGSRNISSKSFFATSNIVWGQAGRLDSVKEFRFLKITPDVRDEYVSTMYS